MCHIFKRICCSDFSLPGMNGVMVSTNNTWSNDDYTVVFNDKCTFNLIAKSQRVALDAILCEKGKILTAITGDTHRSLLTLQGTPAVPY